MILLIAKVSKISLNIDLKIILLNHKNNYISRSDVMNNAAKSFDILVFSLNYIERLI